MSSNLPLKKNFGREVLEELPYLARQLDEMYTDIAIAIGNLVKKNVISGSDPVSSPGTDQRNSLFSIGDITVRTDTDAVWVMTSRVSAEEVTWTAV